MYHVDKEIKGNGEKFVLIDTARKYFKKIDIFGNSSQQSEPTADNPIEIRNVGDNVNLIDEQFRQGGWNNTTATTRIYTTQNRFLEAGQYSFSSNIDTTIFRIGLNVATQPFPILEYVEGSFIYDSNWITENEKTFSIDKDGYFGINLSKIDGSNITIEEVAGFHFKLEKGPIITTYSLHEQGNMGIIIDDEQTEHDNIFQNYIFPLKQRMMLNDYLAEDGIHHTRKQVTFSGTNITLEDAKQNGNYLCTHKSAGILSGKTLQFDTEVTDAVIEYELENEEIEEYNSQQLQIYQIIVNTAYSYNGRTAIYSNDEISPIFSVIAYKGISEEFKNRLLNGKITRAYLKVLATETLEEIIIDENNYLKDLKIEELRYVPDEGFIGGTVAKRVTGNFNNIDSSFNIQDREMEVYIGVELEDTRTEYIKFGTYIVQKPEDNQVNDNTSFVALDYMTKFNIEYVDRVKYPCTLKDLFYDIVDQAGVKTKVITFPNENFLVENNQFETGATLRSVLKGIAQVAFNWARIDEEDNLLMDFEIKENYDEILGPDDYFNYKKTNEYGPINVIVFRNSQVEGENITIKNYDVLNMSETKNICSNRWVEGQYNSETGEIGPYENRVRQEALLAVEPNTEYYVDTFNPNYKLLIRTFLENKTFSRNLSALNTFTTNENEAYIGVTLYGLEDTTSDLKKLIEEKIIKPFICLNSEEDKSFIPFEGMPETELVISDNPFAYTQEKRVQLIEAGRRLFGLTYTPMSMDMIGFIYLNAVDKIGATNLNGQTFYTYLLNHTINYTGVVLDSMESQAKTRTETKYQFMPQMIQALKHTEITVDKANQKIEAVAKKEDETSEKVSKLEIDLDGLTSTVAKKDDVQQQINKLEQTIEGTTNKLSTIGGNNIFYFSTEYWEKLSSSTTLGISSISNTTIKNNTNAGFGYLLDICSVMQKQKVKNGKYTISYSYLKLKSLATGYIVINGQKVDFTAAAINNWYDNDVTINVTNNLIEIELHSDTSAAFYLADLMVAAGEEKQVWSQNANETITDTVQIGKGVQVNSSAADTYTRIDADGNRTYNSITGDVVAEMTKDGIYGKELEIKEQAKINGILVQTIGTQIWISSLL